MKERLLWADNAKFLGIILMVLGHTGIVGHFPAAIYTFHMPLFFILSGYFAPVDNIISFKQYFIHNFKSILVPYLFFCLVYLPLGLYVSYIHPEMYRFDSTGEFILKHIAGIVTVCNSPISFFTNGPIWFLPALFIAKMLHYLCIRFRMNHYYVVLSCFCVAVGYWLIVNMEINTIVRVAPALLGYIFFELGCFARQYGAVDRCLNMKMHIKLLVIAIATLVCYFSTMIDGNRFDMSLNYYGISLLLSICTAVIGSLGLILVASFIPNTKTTSTIGRGTITILGIHWAIMSTYKKLSEIIIGMPEAEVQLWWAILTTIVVIAIHYPIILFLNRYLSWAVGKSKK